MLQAVTSKGKTEFAQIQPDDETFPLLKNTRRFRLPRSRYAFQRTMSQPMGLSVWNAAFVPEQHWVASEAGTYRLVVDVFTDSDAWSYNHMFDVYK